MSDTLFYRCEKCGNIVALIKAGGGTLTCCGQTMTKLEANSTDAAKEKHVPVLTSESGKIKVAVGSVAHPMTAEHYIQWIALVSEDRIEITYLMPGMEPKAEFVYSNNSSKSVTVYAYCNLHGLWKAEL
jgi:superoxide reductase